MTTGYTRGDEAISDNACLNYAMPGTAIPENFEGAVITVCRIDVAQSKYGLSAAPPRDQFDGRVVRRLSDGTVLEVASGTGYGRTVSRTELARIAAHTDVSPNLRRPSTWESVN